MFSAASALALATVNKMLDKREDITFLIKL